jgi:hypothetical protein
VSAEPYRRPATPAAESETVRSSVITLLMGVGLFGAACLLYRLGWLPPDYAKEMLLALVGGGAALIGVVVNRLAFGRSRLTIKRR